MPHVFAHIDRGAVSESVVPLRCHGREECIVLWEVERRDDVGDTVVEPCPERVEVVFSWRPRRGAGEEASSDAREVPERWIFVGLAPA